MRKICSAMLLILFMISNFWIWEIYANKQSEIEKISQVLDSVGGKMEIVVNKLDDKIKDKEISTKLREKEKEIKEYIKEAKQDINVTKSSKELKEIVEETSKVVVLKVVSWVTKYDDIKDNISDEVAKTKVEKKQALDTLQDSLKKDDFYRLIIKTKENKNDLLKKYRKFDEKLKIDFLYSESKQNYYEFFVSNDSIFRKEILEDIGSWNIPDSFLWIEVVTPEVFTINNKEKTLSWILSPSQEKEATNILNWENLDLTWWVSKFNPSSYLDLIKDSQKIKVWVIDTWIDYNHPDLKWKVSGWYDFINNDNDAYDDQWHGTHIAWIIWSNINNTWIVWVNPYVELVPLKICNDKWFCPNYAIIKALEYAKENKLDILNMSLWARANTSTNPICDAIKSVTQNNIIVVASSWNSNIDAKEFVPWWCRNTITVWAVDKNLKRASFSNYGQTVDISAPWVWIYSTQPNGKYKKLSWTSMATPHIVWLVSVMKSLKKELTIKEIKNIFRKNNIKTEYIDNKYMAWFPDVDSILNTFNSEKDIATVEIQELNIKEEVQEEVLDNKQEKILLRSTLDPNFNYETKKYPKENTDELKLEVEHSWVNIKSIDFPKKENLDLELNSDWSNSEVEVIDIEEVFEEKKDTIIAGEDQIFDENGNKLDIEVNSIEDIEEEQEPEIFEPINKPLYIDWAKEGLDTNSNEEKAEIIIKEEYEEIELIEEKVLNLKFADDFFIDWAEKWLGINNNLEETEEEIEKRKITILEEWEEIPAREEKNIIEEEKEPEEKHLQSPENESILIENLEIFDASSLEQNWTYINSFENDPKSTGLPIITETTKQWSYYTKWLDWARSYWYSISSNDLWISILAHKRLFQVKTQKTWTVYIKVWNLYILKLIIEPATIIEKELIVWESYTHEERYAYWLNFEKSDDTLWEVHSTKWDYRVDTKKIWVLDIKVTDSSWYLKYILRLDIKSPPPPKEYDISVAPYERVNLFFPNKREYYYYNMWWTGWYTYLYSYDWYIRVKWVSYWTQVYHVKNRNWHHIYTININVAPRVQIIEKEVYETKNLEIRLSNWHSYTYTVSDTTKVSIYKWWNRFSIKWINPWTVEIYASYNWVHFYTYKINVLEKPKPIEYNIEIYSWVEQEIVLPEDLWRYNVYTNIDWLYNNRVARTSRNRIYIKTNWEWTAQIRFIKRWWSGFAKYIVNITSKIYKSNISLVKTEYTSVWISSRDTYSFWDSSLWYINSPYIYAKNPWETDIKIYRDWYLKKIIHFTVLPIPESEVIECSTYIWDRCIFTVSNSGYTTKQSSSWVWELRTWKRSFYVTWLRPWVFEVHIEKYRGEYVSHIFKVTVKAKPVRLFTCTAPEWLACNTNWWWEEREYTYTVSDTSILDLRLLRQYEWGKIYEKLEVKWKKPWVADVYVYENGIHTATFTITVEAPIKPITVSSSWANLKQLESIEIDILDWGWDYTKLEWFDSDIIWFIVQNTEWRKWVIKISWKKPWTTKVTLKDKYGQTLTFWVRVDKVELKLSYPKTWEEWYLHLNGNYEYVSIKESYLWIKKITRDNDNIDAYLTSIEVDWELLNVIKVIPKSIWVSYLRVEDNNANYDIIKVVVGGVEEIEKLIWEDTSEEVFNSLDIERLLNEEWYIDIFTEELIDSIKFKKEELDINIKINWIFTKGYFESWEEFIDKFYEYFLKRNIKYEWKKNVFRKVVNNYRERLEKFVSWKSEEYLRSKAYTLRVKQFKKENIYRKLPTDKLYLQIIILRTWVASYERALLWDKERGELDWSDEAYREYKEELWSLFDIWEISSLIGGLWDVLKLNPLDLWSDLVNYFNELKNLLINIENILEWHSEYEIEYYRAYLKTKLSLSAIPFKYEKLNHLKKLPSKETKLDELREKKKEKDNEEEDKKLPKCNSKEKPNNIQQWVKIWLSWFKIKDMNYQEMLSCSDKINWSAKWSLFEKWIKIHKLEYKNMQRYIYQNKFGKKRVSDWLLEERSAYGELNTLDKNILVEMKNYKTTSKITKGQLEDYLTECNQVNEDRKDRFWNVKEWAWKEMWIRYIFSRKPWTWSISVFESVGWSELKNNKECKQREIKYFDSKWILINFN